MSTTRAAEGHLDRTAAVPEWVGPALESVLGRVAVTRTEVAGRFPLFADSRSGRWTTTGRGSWTGGFWAGLLWLRARHTGQESDREAAVRCTGRLTDWVDTDTATRGLIFWYGTALADTPEAAALRARAARACRGAYDAELGLVPWGSAFGGPRLLARVDGVPGMVPLLTSVDPWAARSHLHRHLELCAGEGPSYWSWRYERSVGWAPCDDPPPGWSRGRAWLLLAVADAVHHPDTDDLAEVVDRLLQEPSVPPADAGHPDGPLDTSAAAITTVALLKLGHRDQAVALLDALVSTHVTANGRLVNGCYDLSSGTATQHELVWGDFFLAYALAALAGLVDPHDV
ncbi:glycoside hydrolase family 88 protein [Streptomyces sp. AK010]|uniref:glycoside hydrolase family 88 protein n=1 Tax=Streptomyces sp. AK010 TaxID=2723074 RepID=UPI0018142F8A|nr:glycoside hydrolase family 88 protein [Streptomyces sp. AK010]MBB6420073.1 unsaturated chondroitin disaccharide hydrolase [Streptomyces sp. AK010]